MNRFILMAGLAAALTALAMQGGHAQTTAPGQAAPIAAAASTAGAAGTSAAVLGEPARIEVAFVLDTTGSMGGLIDGAKQKIWAIADEIRKSRPNAEIRIGLVAYRDRGDAYVAEATDLSNDIHAVYGKLLGFQAQGGGDWPESVNEALSVAVNRLSWTKTPDTRRLIFLVGDAPPHMDYPQDVPFTDTLKIAEREGIVVDALQCGNAPDTELAWKTIAQLGHGRWVRIPQSGGVVTISSPFDDAIIRLQIRLHRTIVPYGSLKRQSEVKAKSALAAAAPASAASDMASYFSRAGKPEARTVVSGDGDLIADVVARRVAPSEVKRDDLPPEMRELAKAEVEKAIGEKVAERGRLQGELAELVAKRDAWVDEQKATRTGVRDGFDSVVEDLVRERVK
jgi:uncharacterized protein YegL